MTTSPCSRRTFRNPSWLRRAVEPTSHSEEEALKAARATDSDMPDEGNEPGLEESPEEHNDSDDGQLVEDDPLLDGAEEPDWDQNKDEDWDDDEDWEDEDWDDDEDDDAWESKPRRFRGDVWHWRRSTLTSETSRGGGP